MLDSEILESKGEKPPCGLQSLKYLLSVPGRESAPALLQST